MSFRIRQPVRHPDVDRAGIVYFPRYYDFFHRALEDFFAQEVGVPLWELGERAKVAFPVIRIETDFDAPLAHGDVVTIQLSTLELREHAVVLRYEVFRPDATAPASVSRMVLCAIEPGTFTKRPVPPQVRAAFERHLA